jgi:hypothetical protein
MSAVPAPSDEVDDQPRRQVRRRFEGLRGRLDLDDLRLEGCIFDNCSASGGTVRRVEIVDATTWACSVDDVVLEDSRIEGLKTSYPGGGKKMPFFLWGALAHRVVLAGPIGGVIWNPPEVRIGEEGPADAFAGARDFYATVDDWALDVREARFRSVPSLRYGPPGHLVLHDEETQPLLTREQAGRALAAGAELGVWRIVLEGFLQAGWMDSVVLIPPAGASRRAYEGYLAQALLARSAAGPD